MLPGGMTSEPHNLDLEGRNCLSGPASSSWRVFLSTIKWAKIVAQKLEQLCIYAFQLIMNLKKYLLNFLFVSIYVRSRPGLRLSLPYALYNSCGAKPKK